MRGEPVKMNSLKFTILTALLVHGSNAWLWSPSGGDEGQAVNFDLEVNDPDSFFGRNDNDADGDAAILEEDDAESEQNLRCAASFNRNLQNVLKSIMPQNYTLERFNRQVDDPDTAEELFQSTLNLELSQVLVPVLKILGSAAAANATAIDQNYNSLPFVVRYQVTDLLKYAVDLIKDEGEFLSGLGSP